jgi:hypothetical protein
LSQKLELESVLHLFTFDRSLPIETNIAYMAKSYNNSETIREIIGTDHSGFTEPILTTEDHHLIDSLTTIDNEHLRIDSIKGQQRAEGAHRKRPLGLITQKLACKWLESLAKQRWKLSGVPNI